MPEKIEELVRKAVSDAQEAGDLPAFEVGDLGLERPADAGNGDWTTTLALRSARLAHMAPRAIAQAIVDHMAADPGISKVEVAGPGFVNFYLSAAANNEVFRTVREQGHDFGRSNIGAGEKVQVEFVSANPVGPLHIGHGRWAALGDSLCRVMEHAGYSVEREYYINDHGSQMDVFGNSVAERYLQLAQVMAERGCSLDDAVQVLLDDRKAFVKDEEDAHPELHPYMDAFNANLGGNAYGGDYIIDVARYFIETDGTRWVEADPKERMLEFRERGYKLMLESIRSTLDESRCHFDVWLSRELALRSGRERQGLPSTAPSTPRRDGLPIPPTTVPCGSARPTSATTRTACSSRPTASSRTSRATWPTITTRCSAASTISSTSGAPTTTATSSAARP